MFIWSGQQHPTLIFAATTAQVRETPKTPQNDNQRAVEQKDAKIDSYAIHGDFRGYHTDFKVAKEKPMLQPKKKAPEVVKPINNEVLELSNLKQNMANTPISSKPKQLDITLQNEANSKDDAME